MKHILIHSELNKQHILTTQRNILNNYEILHLLPQRKHCSANYTLSDIGWIYFCNKVRNVQCLIQYILSLQELIQEQTNKMSQTQLVRSAINIFIVVAISISIFQQLLKADSSQTAVQPSVTTATGQQVPLQMTGPKIQGIRIQASDKLQTPMKQLLAINQINIQISSYQFQGNQYWINMIANWGHIVLVYVLIGKYKTQTNDNTKKKIMIGGGIAVMAWFYFSSSLKPQALAIQVQGTRVYDKQYLDDKQVLNILNEYEFQIQDLKQAQNTNNDPSHIQKNDAWEATQQQQKVQPPRSEQNTQQVVQQEQIF